MSLKVKLLTAWLHINAVQRLGFRFSAYSFLGYKQTIYEFSTICSLTFNGDYPIMKSVPMPMNMKKLSYFLHKSVLCPTLQYYSLLALSKLGIEGKILSLIKSVYKNL